MTDSPYVAVHAEMDVLRRMNHFPLSGSCGFDMYVDGRYMKTFVPPYSDIDNGYESILSRKLNRDFIHLGFSGAARAEIPLADHIKNLDMSLFVYDYDYNAPNPEELVERHERMFLIICEANPTLPILIMSKPKFILEGNDILRRDIIETTYKNALARGDKNVYFLDGPALMALCGEDGTVDNVHPTDFGFASMAKAIEELMIKNNL